MNKEIEDLILRVETMEAKWDGLVESVMGMCEVMDKLIEKLSQMTGAKGEVGKEIIKSMGSDMSDFYEMKLREMFDVVVELDVGDRVICDLCGKDWTDSEVSGGFMFDRKCVCPECEPGLEETALREGEEDHISQRCPKELSHAEWVRDIVRKGIPVKRVSDWKKGDGR